MMAQEEVVYQTQFLNFVRFPQAPTAKTSRWEVRSRRVPLMVLGVIRWYSAWRQYAFFPQPLTVFNVECLQNIMEFIDGQMARRRAS